MPQTFNPDNVLLQDSLGKEIVNAGFTDEFLRQLVSTSRVVQLGQKVDMGNQRMRRFTNGVGELSDAYFVGEGEKIGTAKVEGTDYVLEAKKIGVILPVTEEFLTYSWTAYFTQIIPVIVDKFNKKIDGAAFLGLHGNPFGSNVLSAAESAGNVINGELSAKNIIDLEAQPRLQPNAFVGHRDLTRELRRLNGAVAPQSGLVETVAFEAPNSPIGNGTLDGLAYAPLNLANGDEYPKGTLIVGYFNSLKYGIPNGANLRLKIADQASLSKVQNTSPDSGDVHLFEQDMQALRAIFEIGVAIPKASEGDFAVIKPEEV